MTTQLAGTSVQTSTIVESSAEHAFKVFTEGIDTWWNRDHHLLADKFDHMVFEPRVGGHVYDVGTDGSERRWARVLAYEPPHRLVFSWDITPSWEIESDPAKASEVEVRFIAEGPKSTRVELEHKHLERHGSGWESMRDAVGSPNGWNLEGFAAAVAREAA